MSSSHEQYTSIQYQPLKENEIRLLKLLPGAPDDPIRAELFHITLEAGHIPYNALSYTWGSQENFRAIFVDGRLVCVGSNLEEALKAERRVVPQRAIDWKWQREEISEAIFKKRKFIMSGLIQAFNESTRSTWDSNLLDSFHMSDEKRKELLEDYENLDEQTKESLQSWWQLCIWLSLTCAEPVVTGLTTSAEEHSVDPEFKCYLQAAVEQEEVIRKRLEQAEYQEPSVEYLHKMLRRGLDHFRVEAPQYLWVDALCINQDDVKERNFEVKRMGEIYARATKPVVWLGPQESHPIGDSQTAIDYFNAADKARKSGEENAARWIEKTLTGDILKAVVKFFTRPWFKRVWIIQEYVVSARRLVFLLSSLIQI
jgi:hypothetical protein